MKKKLFILSLFLSCIYKAQPGFVSVNVMGGGGTDSGNGIAVDNEGNVYTTGFFRYTVDFDPGPGIYNLTSQSADFDIFVTKIDSQGNLIWARRFGGNGTSGGQGYKIAVDQDQNVYTTGYFGGTCDFDPGSNVYNLTAYGTDGMSDVFISKLDVNGNFVWAKQIGAPNGGNEIGYSIAVDKNGNVYTTGTCGGDTDFDPGPGSYTLSYGVNSFVSKLDSNGNFEWAKGIEIPIGPSSGFTEGHSLCVDDNENVYITGFFRTTKDFDPGPGQYFLTASSNYNTYIWKLDMNGDLVWVKQIDGNGSTIANSIKTDKNGYIYLTGLAIGSPDFDPGAPVYNIPSNAGQDIFIEKLDSNGNFVWAKRIGSVENEEGRDIAVGADGIVYTIGKFKGTADFDPGNSTYNLTSFGQEDIFISVLDSSGNFVCAGHMGGISTDWGNSIVVDSRNTIYATGLFVNTADFDPAASQVQNKTSQGANDIFISKLSQCQLLSMGAKKIENDLDAVAIFPNPTTGVFQVSCFLNETCDLKLSVCNVAGQRIYSETVPSCSGKYFKAIDLSKYAKGVYFMEIVADRKRTLKKVVVD